MLWYKQKNDNYIKMRYPLMSILNLMYKLCATINIEILYKSCSTNFNIGSHPLAEEASYTKRGKVK